MQTIVHLFFVFLIATSPLAAGYDLAICAIFKDEAPWFKEWIEFHKMQGVEHFFLYNNNSSDNYLEVLTPYISAGEVTLTEWPDTHKPGDLGGWLKVQNGSYMDCINAHRSDVAWLAVIDIDEFLFCVDGQKLPDFLKNYSDYPGLCVNWVKFGTSHVEDLEPNKLLIETLTSCIKPNPEKGENRFVKSIVQPAFVTACTSPHFFMYSGKKPAVNSSFYPVRSSHSKSAVLDKIRINHYWTRTEWYLREKKIARRIDQRNSFTLHMIEIQARKFNQWRDATILQFVAELRKMMGFDLLN